MRDCPVVVLCKVFLGGTETRVDCGGVGGLGRTVGAFGGAGCSSSSEKSIRQMGNEMMETYQNASCGRALWK